MPKATTSGQETERYELKTLPEGFVVLRRLTYGEWLKRRQMTSDMRVRGGSKKDDFEGVLQLMNEKATLFEFKNCIVDHNLEDEEGNLLDFKNPMTFQQLDPRVGDEIGRYISEMNQFESDDEDF